MAVEEPKLFKIRLQEASTGVYSEGTFEETTYQDSRSSISHSRFFVGPLLGLSMDGSVFHPNLFRFNLNNEGAYGYSYDQVKGPGGTRERQEQQYIGRFQGSADILGNKPFRANIYGGYDHSYRDYDFFNRVIVDSWRYGSRLTYHSGPWYVGATYSHRDEEVTGFLSPTISHDDVIGFDARHDRQRGSTAFNYVYNEYSRSDFGNLGTGIDHTVGLADSERFGSRDQFQWNTTASYNHREASFENTDQFLAQSTLEAQHRETLSSYYDLSYDRFQSGAFLSDGYAGRAELRHQLFASLTSRLIAQGSDTEFSSDEFTGYMRRYGGGLAEAYVKNLSAEHRLRIENSILIEQVQQQTIGRVERERHSFAGEGGGASGLFFLNLPNVIESSIVVRDQNGIQQWVRDLDYSVISGARTAIERIPGSRIPPGATVLVDYRAEPSPGGEYQNLSDFFQVRVDLWKNLWGLFTRVNLSLNNAPSELRVQDMRSYSFGTDFTWRWFRAGAEYIIYDSDQSDYRATRLFQSFTFHPDDQSTLGLNFFQSWTDYVDARRQEEDYRFTSRYRRLLTPRFSFEVEAGFDFRRGTGVDQTLATVRPSLQYNINKLSVNAGYDYEYNLFLNNEERTKHLFFLRARRSF